MDERRAGPRRVGCVLLAVALVAMDYLWCLWYMGGLYRGGACLSVREVSADNLRAMLAQHIAVSLPDMLVALGALLVLRRRFARDLGLTAGQRRGRIAVSIAGGIYALLLVAALVRGGTTALAAAYQWIYYLGAVALAEEFLFRAVLPRLMEAGGLPAWCAWIVPGVLFGAVHTLMPVIQGGMQVRVLLTALLSTVWGGAIGSCALYELRRWSGTLWFPVLVHAALDFAGALF